MRYTKAPTVVRQNPSAWEFITDDGEPAWINRATRTIVYPEGSGKAAYVIGTSVSSPAAVAAPSAPATSSPGGLWVAISAPFSADTFYGQPLPTYTPSTAPSIFTGQAAPSADATRPRTAAPSTSAPSRSVDSRGHTIVSYGKTTTPKTNVILGVAVVGVFGLLAWMVLKKR